MHAELKNILEYERKRYGIKSNFEYLVKRIYGSENAVIYHWQILLRKIEYFSKHKDVRYYFYKIRFNNLSNKYGLHIPENTCKKGLKIMHLGSILINKNASIGENVSLHIDTAIVAGGNTNKAPIIGNDVVVGIGAKLIGDITITNGIAIGAGSIVTKSFNENNITIAGVPARKISDIGADSWNNKKGEK